MAFSQACSKTRIRTNGVKRTRRANTETATKESCLLLLFFYNLIVISSTGRYCCPSVPHLGIFCHRAFDSRINMLYPDRVCAAEVRMHHLREKRAKARP